MVPSVPVMERHSLTSPRAAPRRRAGANGEALSMRLQGGWWANCWLPTQASRTQIGIRNVVTLGSTMIKKHELLGLTVIEKLLATGFIILRDPALNSSCVSHLINIFTSQSFSKHLYKL